MAQVNRYLLAALAAALTLLAVQTHRLDQLQVQSAQQVADTERQAREASE